MFPNSKKRSKGFAFLPNGSRAFSLVEICLALGIVSCSMLVIVGLLPVGLQTMQDSAVQYGTATIAQQISSELQEMPFSPSATNTAYAVTALGGGSPHVEYYTREGMKTTATATDMNTYPYFQATFSTNNPTVPGAATSTYPSNVQVVNVTLAFPYIAPSASRQTNVLSFLVAKQNNL